MRLSGSGFLIPASLRLSHPARVTTAGRVQNGNDRLCQEGSVIPVARNKRRSKRIPALPDRAQILVVVEGQEHRAVMVDQSSDGFGVYVLPGVPIQTGVRLQVICDEGIHVCDVMHMRHENDFEYLGLKRVETLPLLETPRRAKQRRWYKVTISSKPPVGFIAFSFVLAFACTAGFLAGRPYLEKILGGRTSQKKMQSAVERMNASRKRANEAAADVASLKDRLTKKSDASSHPALTPQAALLSQQQQTALLRLFGPKPPSWSDLVRRVELNADQEARLPTLAGANLAAREAPSRAIAQARVNSILSEPQRVAFARLVAEYSGR